MKNAQEFLKNIQKYKDNTAMNSAMLTQQVMERKNVLDLNIVVGVDVSGSISYKQFSQFMAQLDAIKGLSRIKVLEVDTKVVAMYDYVGVSRNRIAKLGGGGGTEFSEAFNIFKKIKPDAILFMTDGHVSGNIAAPNIPVGWILTQGGRKPFGFGEVVVQL